MTASSRVTDLALIATFAAFLAVCSVTAALPIGVNGVPITLQTFGVLMCGAVLGTKRGFLAVLLYLAVGIAGIPVFAAGAAGVAPFASPTAGYLISFPFAAGAIGLSAGYVDRASGRANTIKPMFGIIAGGLAAEVLIYICGATGMMIYAGMGPAAALAAGALYIPGDLVKLAAVTVLASAVHRAFPSLPDPARS